MAAAFDDMPALTDEDNDDDDDDDDDLPCDDDVPPFSLPTDDALPLSDVSTPLVIVLDHKSFFLYLSNQVQQYCVYCNM